MNYILQFNQFIKGHRTYALAFCGILVIAIKHFGYIDNEVQKTALEILGFGTAASLRASVSNLIQGEPTGLPQQ